MKLLWNTYFVKHPERNISQCILAYRVHQKNQFEKSIEDVHFNRSKVFLSQFYDAYEVNLWEKISVEVRLTHAKLISIKFHHCLKNFIHVSNEHITFWRIIVIIIMMMMMMMMILYLFSVIMYSSTKVKLLHITKVKLLHINKYIKPYYLGTDQYRVQAKKFH